MQEKALKYITNDFISPYNELLEHCQKTTLYITRIKKILEFTFRILNDQLPHYLSNFVNLKKNPMTLRAQYALNLPKYDTITHRKNSFKYKAAFYWNTLCNDTKTTNNIHGFKLCMKEWSPSCSCGFCILCKLANM